MGKFFAELAKMKLVRWPPILNNGAMKSQPKKNVKRGFQDFQVTYDSRGDLLFYGSVLKPSADPAYVYSAPQLQHRAKEFLGLMKKSLDQPLQIHYAMKANSNPQILKTLKSLGYCIDVVSLGELKIALKAGFKPNQVLFSGVGKTKIEIQTAIKLKIFQLNVESIPELERVGQIAERLKTPVNIGVRINPGVNPQTHPYIATGFRENKFGIDPTQLKSVLEIFRRYKNLRYQGLSLHIGSQIFDFSPLAEAIQIALKIDKDLEAQGFVSKVFDVGGGIGVDYKNSSEMVDSKTLQDFLKVLQENLHDCKKKLCFEPGRFLVARAGVLLTEVQYVKETPYKKFVVVNTGMNHLLRPALYQAFHRIIPLKLSNDKSNKKEIVDVVGPVCESSDVLGQDRNLPGIKEGDWLAILDVGAYGFSMASSYNSFPLPKEIFQK